MGYDRFAILPRRGVISVGGAERQTFLQGLLTSDVTRCQPDRAIWAALLTPQGKYLHDLFIACSGPEEDASWWMECESERQADLFKRLRMYRLRSKVDLEEATDRLAVAVLWNSAEPDMAAGLDGAGKTEILGGGVMFADPRHPAAGGRAILPRETAREVLEAAGMTEGDEAEWDRRRIRLGLPDSSRDLLVDKSVLLENGFDELAGVDWKKGCYVGQEVTARTKYRGLVKKRLLPVSFAEAPSGPLETGTALRFQDKAAGELRSLNGTEGLALMRLEAVEALKAGDGGGLVCEGIPVTVHVPAWAKLPSLS